MLEIVWIGKRFEMAVQTRCLIPFPFILPHPNTLFGMNWNVILFHPFQLNKHGLCVNFLMADMTCKMSNVRVCALTSKSGGRGKKF